MAPTRQKKRNYRRQPPPDSSPEATDHRCQLLPSSPPPVVAVSLSPGVASSAPQLPLYSEDAGGHDNSPVARDRGIGDGDREDSQSFACPSFSSQKGAVEGDSPSIRNGGSQVGTKRIASGFGYNMLKSMGWRENTGLGQLCNGIVDPILAKPKPNHLGIGFNPTAAHNAAQEKIRQIQEVKREERDRKLQLKLEKAQAAEEEAIFMRESYVAVSSTSHEHIPELDAGLQGNFSDAQHSKHVFTSQEHKSTEPGQCPHCRQRFDTKYALKSHINARHANVLLATTRQLKIERKRGGHQHHGGGGRNSRSGKGRSAHGLAPLTVKYGG